MLFLQLTGGAAFALLALPGWERERISDALIMLIADPRPPFATTLPALPGEAFEIWVGSEHRLHYRVYKDDAGTDLAIVVFGVF